MMLMKVDMQHGLNAKQGNTSHLESCPTSEHFPATEQMFETQQPH